MYFMSIKILSKNYLRNLVFCYGAVFSAIFFVAAFFCLLMQTVELYCFSY